MTSAPLWDQTCPVCGAWGNHRCMVERLVPIAHNDEPENRGCNRDREAPPATDHHPDELDAMLDVEGQAAE